MNVLNKYDGLIKEDNLFGNVEVDVDFNFENV